MRADTPSRTAEMVALIRATDQRRRAEQRILDDPYARHFLGPLARGLLRTLELAGPLAQPMEAVALGLVPSVLARHQFIDEHLLRFLADPSPAQVVLLGAGYDSRAWRLASQLAGRPLFEVDHPATAARKARLVEQLTLPPARRVLAVTDFLSSPLDQVLVQAGFDAGVRSYFVWEGVSMYLSQQAVEATLHTLAKLAAPGSQLGMDFWFPLEGGLGARLHRLAVGLVTLVGEPVTFGLPPDRAAAFLAAHGWSLEELAEPATLRRRHGRGVYPSVYVVQAALRAG